MAEVTRIVTIQATLIERGDVDELVSKDYCEKAIKDDFAYCDDVKVTVQDFVIEKE